MATSDLYAQMLMRGIPNSGNSGNSAIAARLLAGGRMPPIPNVGSALAYGLSEGLNAFTGQSMLREEANRDEKRRQRVMGEMRDHLDQQQRRRDAITAGLFGEAPPAPTPQAPLPSAPPSGPVGREPLPAPQAAAEVPPELMPHFEAASRETGIPVPLLVAQARQESNFNPNAVGRSGEIGLTQIMPSTARQPGYGVQPTDPEALRDPAANILFGARYLAGRGRAAGVTDWNDPAQVDVALRAYNGGGDPRYAENVRRWMPQGEGMATPVNNPAQGGAGVAPAPGGATPSAPPSAPGARQPNMEVLQRMLTSGDPQLVQQAQGVLQMMQAQRQANQPGPTVQMVGPQGPGVYERLPNGGVRFLGGQPEGAPVSNQRHKQDLARAEAGRPSVEVRTGQNFGEQLASGAARQIGELRTAARAATDGLRASDRIADLLDSGVITGTAAEFRLGLDRALRTAGLIDGNRVTNTEQLMSELARGTLEAAGGLSGPTSDRDIMFLREVAGGSITLTPETIRRIATIARERNERTIGQYNDMAGIVSRDETLPPAMRELYRPMDFPTRERRPPAAAPAAPGQGGGWSIQPIR